MKPTFKTTALAILVSLGAVACSSTSSADHPLSKQSIQDNNKSEAEQKRLEEEAKIKAEEAQKAKDLEEKARLEREDKERAEEAKRLEEARAEQKRLEEEAKIKAEEAQKAKDLEEKARLEREAKERADEAKRLEEARIQAELNKMPKITGDVIKKRLIFGNYVNDSVAVIPREVLRKEYTYIDTDKYIDIKEAIKNDIQKGGKYAGLHKGTYKSTTGLDYPKVIELDDKSFEHGSNQLIAKKIDYNNKDINYLFNNNPYSSYGALFVDRHSSVLFAEFFTDQDSNFKAGYYIKDGVEYNMESLQGKTFTYKGNIIATATRAVPNTNVIMNDEPTEDGDITFKIKFNEKADSNEFYDFVINSKLLGNDIKLKNHEWSSSCHSASGSCGAYFPYKNRNDPINRSKFLFLSMDIVDKDANEVVGDIDIDFSVSSEKLSKNGVSEYHGVFGATKQPE